MELTDDEHTLAAISQRLAGIFAERYGCDPGDVDTYAVDDILFVVMRDGGLTAAERTMIEIGGPDRVVELRREFQRMIAGRYRQEVAELTGHRVLGSLSQAHVAPQLMIEILFVGAPFDRELAPPGGHGDGRAGLLGFDDIDGAGAVEGPVDEEDLDRDVGLDLGLGEEADHLRSVSSSIACLHRSPIRTWKSWRRARTRSATPSSIIVCSRSPCGLRPAASTWR